MSKEKEQLHVVMAVFTRQDQAAEAFERVKAWGKEHLIDLADIALVSRGSDNKVTVYDAGDPSSGSSAGKGAAAGAVVGLFFPPTVIVGAAVGAAAGAAYGHFRDKGLNNKKLRAEGDRLEPGQSAVIAAANDQFVGEVVEGLEGLGLVGEYYLDLDTGDVQDVKSKPGATAPDGA